MTHRKVCILNVGKGATSVTGTGDLSWSEENGVLRSTAQTQYQACIAALGEENEDYVLGGLLWIQGEADTGGVGNGTTPVSTYKTKTINVFNFFRWSFKSSITSYKFLRTSNNINYTILYDQSNNELVKLNGYLDIGLNDTIKDLIVNFIGALIFNIFGFLYLKNRDKDIVVKNFIITNKKIKE